MVLRKNCVSYHSNCYPKEWQTRDRFQARVKGKIKAVVSFFHSSDDGTRLSISSDGVDPNGVDALLTEKVSS